jgi:AAA domain
MSQNAADVLAEQAGCRVENIARARVHGWDGQFPNGGLVIVDEAAMAGTPVRLAERWRRAGVCRLDR